MPGNINIERLDELIQTKFGSYKAFAEAVGLSKQYVSEVLRGKLEPSVGRLILFADHLDVCADEILIRQRGS